MNEEAADALSVTVRRSGGFAGISRVWALSLADTDTDLSSRLRDLAAQAAAAPLQAPEPGSADGFHYDVLLESGAGSSTLSAAEPGLPDSFAELVDLVRTHGEPA